MSCMMYVVHVTYICMMYVFWFAAQTSLHVTTNKNFASNKKYMFLHTGVHSCVHIFDSNYCTPTSWECCTSLTAFISTPVSICCCINSCLCFRLNIPKAAKLEGMRRTVPTQNKQWKEAFVVEEIQCGNEMKINTCTTMKTWKKKEKRKDIPSASVSS